MGDVNFVEYGENALRLTDSVGDTVDFWSQNGYELGVILAVFIVLFFFLLILALAFRVGKKIIPI